MMCEMDLRSEAEIRPLQEPSEDGYVGVGEGKEVVDVRELRCS